MYVCSATSEQQALVDRRARSRHTGGLRGCRTAHRLPGDDLTAVKDPVVQRVDGGWRADLLPPVGRARRGGPDDDGARHERRRARVGVARHRAAPRPGRWDARGARVAAVLPDGRAAYDGRATKDENWFERTGLAGPAGEPGRLIQTNEAPVSHVRYLDVLPLPGGGYRIWYEAPLPGESHELRTELIQPEADRSPHASRSLSERRRSCESVLRRGFRLAAPPGVASASTPSSSCPTTTGGLYWEDRHAASAGTPVEELKRGRYGGAELYRPGR